MKTIEDIRKLQHDGEYEDVVNILESIENKTPHHKLIEELSKIFLGKYENPAEVLSPFLETNLEDASVAFLSDIALAFILCGDMQKADAILSKLIANNEADGVAYGRAAAVALSKNELETAQEYYQEAVNREPGRAEWYNNLAGILVRQQRLEEALDNYNIALNYKDDFAQAKESKANILVALDKADELIEELEAELLKDSENYQLRIRLSRTYMLENRVQEAVKNINDVLIKIDNIKILNLDDEELECSDEERETYISQVAYRMALSEMFMEKNRWYMALQVLEQLEKLEPQNMLPIYLKKITIHTEMSKYDKAQEVLETAKEEYPDNNQLKISEASYLCEKGNYEEAEKIQRELLEVYPGDAQLKSQLGQTLLWIGKLDEAGELFKEASEQNPMALAQMVNAKKYPEDEKSIELMSDMVDNPLSPRQVRETMGFAVSEVYEKQKEFDKAFHYLKIANDLVDKEIKYQPKAFSKKIDQTIEVFSKEYFENLEPIRKTDRTPIFVVGMPRSGTTLLEQILSSHEDIFGAGELGEIARLSGLMPRVLKTKKQYPMCMPMMTPHLREEAARFYLKGLEFHDTEHHFVVDKMPHNFQHVGLIHAIMPHAKIIHIQRDPRDNAVSNYQQNFKMKHGGMGFAFNLENIANEINAYNKVMQHWRDIGIPMFEFTYEELVANTDTMSREILEFVGVGYDENVKDFHKTERAVRTASVSQVRQPIYATSKQKWRRYEKYLAPLIDNLNPEVLEPWEKA